MLIIYVSEGLKTVVGRLGRIYFRKGNYIYIGSAKDCLDARLRRHLMKDKKTYWHIDYFLKDERAKISQIWTIVKLIECETANIFNRSTFTETVKKGFGSSDCRCLTHLFYLKDNEKTEEVLKEKGFSRRMEI